MEEWLPTQLLYEVNQRRKQAASKMGDYAKRCVVEMVRRVSRILLQAQREVWAQDLNLNIQSASNFKRPNDNGVKSEVLLSSYHERSFNKPCRRLVPPRLHTKQISLCPLPEHCYHFSSTCNREGHARPFKPGGVA
jgi:hypothetical protein